MTTHFHRTLFSAALFALRANSGQLTIASQSGGPGSSVVVPILFTAQQDSVGAVQFDLTYSGSAMSLSATLGDAGRSPGKILFSLDIGPNQRRFLIVGPNQNSIPSGTVANLFVNINSNAPTGNYALSFSGVAGADVNGNLAVVDSVGGFMAVLDSAGVPLQSEGVLNGGSLLSGPVSPGEFVTLIGSGIGPAGASVLFDGVAAPLLFVSPNQINLVVPFEVSVNTASQLQIMSSTAIIASLSVPVIAATPAILTTNGTGGGQGAILNQDSSLNSTSNPAASGSVATLYASGAGQTDPPGVDGQITSTILAMPVLPITVRVGGLPAEVLYAGTAPGEIAGILQVDFRIPANVPSNASTPVILMVGSASSQPGVTLAIQGN